MNIESIIDEQRIIPVLAFKSVEEALNVSRILVEAGLRLLEVTLRTPVALDCIQAITESLPEARVGAGTIVNPDQVAAARDAGAVFGVSPGLTVELAAQARHQALPFLPGIATVSEALTARALGFRTLKFFPAQISGGSSFLAALKDVLPDLAFCPTGGIHPENAPDYLALGNVRAIGGSWMIKRDASGAIDPIATRAAAEDCKQLVNRAAQLQT